ncbi:MAG TPA: STAS domain-containing protein [Angustibacter sp.]|nr:STAS domain-containing protein [Angustibacter sp.]
MTVTGLRHATDLHLEVAPAGSDAALGGRLDDAAAGSVRHRLHRLVDEGDGDLVLDVSQLSVADAAGLALIVAVHHRARLRGRRVVLLDVPQRLESLIRHTRLQRVLARRWSDAERATARRG